MKKLLYPLVAVILSLLIFISSFFVDIKSLDANKNNASVSSTPVVIIDAGHGGFDGGAVSKEGVAEKDINLNISLHLETYLRLLGYKTVLTRDRDKSLEDEGIETIRAKKTSDIHNRLKIMESIDNSIFISIHQNSYPIEKYSGMQVFFSPDFSEESSNLALSIQSSVTGVLQKDNKRSIKECSDSVYLIYNAVKPAVLVECGFLSNFQEARLLNDDEYQRKIAFCIAIGIEKYVSQG